MVRRHRSIGVWTCLQKRPVFEAVVYGAGASLGCGLRQVIGRVWKGTFMVVYPRNRSWLEYIGRCTEPRSSRIDPSNASFNRVSHQTGSTLHDRSKRDFRLQNILRDRTEVLFHLCILYAHCSMKPSRPVTLPSKAHTYTDSFSCTGVVDVMDSRHRKRQ